MLCFLGVSLLQWTHTRIAGAIAPPRQNIRKEGNTKQRVKGYKKERERERDNERVRKNTERQKQGKTDMKEERKTPTQETSGEKR